MPERIQLKRSKGWCMPENTIKVDRSSKWGNPFVVHGDGVKMDAGNAVACFRSMLEKEGSWFPVQWPWPKGKIPAMPPTTVEDVKRDLRGKNLACWCAIGTPCHADVLLEIANA